MACPIARSLLLLLQPTDPTPLAGLASPLHQPHQAYFALCPILRLAQISYKNLVLVVAAKAEQSRQRESGKKGRSDIKS
jgi:hypothetical protein